MIIIGYQGIGKSSVTAINPECYIDLESSCFNNEDGKKCNFHKGGKNA